MTADTDTDDCDATRSPPTGLMRDIFRSVDSLVPVPFTGCRIHLLAKAAALGWPVTTVFKLNTDGPKPTGLWVSALYEFEQRKGLNVSTMADLNPKSGKWNFEANGRLETSGNWLDASLTGQVCGWCHPIRLQANLDYWFPNRTLSFSIDPLFKRCAFQVLQVNLIYYNIIDLSIIPIYIHISTNWVLNWGGWGVF